MGETGGHGDRWAEWSEWTHSEPTHTVVKAQGGESHTQSIHRTQTGNTCGALIDHRAVDDSLSAALPNVRRLDI